jgi:RNA polymerase sigma-70 factor (ECF subfamily)
MQGPRMALSEQQLAIQAAAGDEGALTTLLRTFGPDIRVRIEASISPKWRSILDADDVMQVTYLEAYLQIERFQPRGDGAFVAWLTRIAENNLRDAVDGLQRMKRPQPERRVLAGDESAIELIEKLGYTTTTPSRQAAVHELQSGVEAAIAGLPEDYARVVRLYDLEGRSAAEIGSDLGRSEGAVYMLRARAHDRLREAFSSVPGLAFRPA